jgi:hypothetical protein
VDEDREEDEADDDKEEDKAEVNNPRSSPKRRDKEEEEEPLLPKTSKADANADDAANAAREEDKDPDFVNKSIFGMKDTRVMTCLLGKE